MLPRLAGVLATSLLAPTALLAQDGQFVVRIGTDTLAIEQYTRTAGQLRGEQVLRSPHTVHRIYTATFGAGGTTERFEVVTHNISGAPGPAQTTGSAVFRDDSAIVQQTRNDSTVTQRVKVGAGALPYTTQSYALVEEVTRRARAAQRARYTTSVLPFGSSEPWAVAVERLGLDSMTLTLGPIGPLRLRVDSQGTLLGLTGAGSTMQVTVERVQGLDLTAVAQAFAARSLGPLSPSDSVTARVAGGTVTVRYSRPSARGRVVFGSVVPWNQVWRTGANDATLLETSVDLVAAGTTVPAGTYSLWTIPSPAGWTLIINRNTGQWGTDYDAKYDLARLAMHVETLPQPVERFTIAIESRGPGGILALQWARTHAWVSLASQ
ncbi:MAG TPA: DUF2911 domain-containing protein [Gemmatimonadales bacterium]|jgi:hypothetical protein|nr:DUF2911 domain-containing protein [Gemmatimonadales bacterium]